MKKNLVLAVVLLAAGGWYFLDMDISSLLDTESEVSSFVSDSGDIEVYFCPHQDCTTPLVDFLGSAQESIHCAMFEIDLDPVRDKLLEKSEEIEVLVVTDNDYLYEFDHPFVKTDTWGLMHNKFCIVDSKKISSGSMNPTNNGANKNNNNLIFIDSDVLATNYEAEFQEMYSGTFKKGEKVLNPSVSLGEIEIQNYFCPEDDCAERIKNELEKATSSIKFMTFSFTHEGIANILLLKHNDGISVEGVMEARQVTKYSQFERLTYQGVDAVKDGNKQNMHHKTFLIDTLSPDCTIITGSMNPTGGGNKRNDENVLIIKDDVELCQAFDEEYEKIREEAES